MAVYIMLSRIAPSSDFKKPEEFREFADKVSEKIRKECPGVHWKESFVTLGRFDVVDILESDDIKQVERAALIIRTQGHSTTETMPATPWKEFLAGL
ncbi:MAG: GYD domain-containing protein [Chloroflexi bacterium]|nr:GYD domain-containing protein [Chloroflexota bacterium]